MKVLLIGGTGLVSTPITRFLLERGDDVTLYNRGVHEARILAGAKRILGDRRDYASFEAQMAEAGRFDCVIDMVCYVPEEARSAMRAFRGRIGQLIFCGTVDVYSRPEPPRGRGGGQAERDRGPRRPDTPRGRQGEP